MLGRVFTWLVFCCVLLGASLVASVASAASMAIRPASQSVAPDSSFTVRISISTDEFVNAFQGALAYPSDLLRVKSVSRAGSIANLWVEEPHDLPAEGQVRWSGGVFNPGYKGSDGLIFSVTFQALAAGTAEVRVATGAVLAADGQGTNVLTSLDAGHYQIVGNAKPTKPEPVPKSTASQAPEPVAVGPNGPVISSPTHPNPGQWYKATTFTARWPLDPKATGVSFLLHDKATADPGSKPDGLLSEKTLTDLADGLHYFHLKFIFGKDQFSAVSHFPVRIDTTPPTLTVTTEPSTNRLRQPVLALKGADILSGLGYYEIQVGAGTVFSLEGSATEFTLPVAKSGTYLVVVKAFDKAGNSTSATATMVANVLEPPTITTFPSTPLVGDPIIISGKAEPAATVRWSMDNSETGTVLADKDGAWTLERSKPLAVGRHEWRFSQRNELGAESAESEPKIMEVINFIRIGGVVVPLRLFVGLVALALISLIITLFTLLKAFRQLRGRAARAALDLEERLDLELEELKHLARQRLTGLKRLKSKRAFSKAEEDIEEALEQAIDRIERKIRATVRPSAAQSSAKAKKRG